MATAPAPHSDADTTEDDTTRPTIGINHLTVIPTNFEKPEDDERDK